MALPGIHYFCIKSNFWPRLGGSYFWSIFSEILTWPQFQILLLVQGFLAKSSIPKFRVIRIVWKNLSLDVLIMIKKCMVDGTAGVWNIFASALQESQRCYWRCTKKFVDNCPIKRHKFWFLCRGMMFRKFYRKIAWMVYSRIYWKIYWRYFWRLYWLPDGLVKYLFIIIYYSLYRLFCI